MTPPKSKQVNTFEEAIGLWGNCHLDKQSKRRSCTYCKKREIKYICAECEVSICDIPCYDLHRRKMEE